MNDEYDGRDHRSHRNEPFDPFAPEHVDHSIAALRQTPGEASVEVRLIHALVAFYAPPASAALSLERVRARVLAAPLASRGAAVAPVPPATPARRLLLRRGHAPAHDRARFQRPRGRFGFGMRALAAVLAVVVLVACFVAVLRQHASTTITSGGWQDAGITANKTNGRPLDFDPARGVTYAVASTSAGTIYACGQNHLWYSANGGQSYAPFTPAMPASTAPNCSIATVPGAPGVFIEMPNPQPPPPGAVAASPPYEYSAYSPLVVGYAQPGTASWNPLFTQAQVPAVGSTAPGVYGYLTPDGPWYAISNNTAGNQVRVVDNWLFMLISSAPGIVNKPPHLFATPDFGVTWLALSAPLESQNLFCAGMAIDPANPHHLFCAAGQESAQGIGDPQDVYETRDGGQTWQPTGLGSLLAGAQGATYGGGAVSALSSGPLFALVPGATSDSAVYVRTRTFQMLRRALAGGSWQRVVSYPPALSVAGVAADDTLYGVSAQTHSGNSLQLQAYRLAPGAAQFTAIGQPAQLSGDDFPLAYALGGMGPGGVPALYAYNQQQPSFAPLLRLVLGGVSPSTGISTLPLPTANPNPPTPTPDPTPTPLALCSATPGNLSAIHDGDFGANANTFAARWGPPQGTGVGGPYYGKYASDGPYFGKYADSGAPQVAINEVLATTNRVWAMIYYMDPKQRETLAQAEAFAPSLLPADAVPQGQLQPSTNGAFVVLTYTYCSAAFTTAVPAGSGFQGPGGAANGVIYVTYWVISPPYGATLASTDPVFEILIGPGD